MCLYLVWKVYIYIQNIIQELNEIDMGGHTQENIQSNDIIIGFNYETKQTKTNPQQ